jgi:hypothetical protein
MSYQILYHDPEPRLASDVYYYYIAVIIITFQWVCCVRRGSPTAWILESLVWIALTARMFVLGLSVLCCSVDVQALRRADRSSRESYCRSKQFHNFKINPELEKTTKFILQDLIIIT